MRTAVVVAGVAALAVVAVTARPAEACSLFTNVAYRTDPTETDVTPPGAVAVSGTHERVGELGYGCGPIGLVVLSATATDDTTSSGDLGYQVRAVQGAFFGAIPTEAIQGAGRYGDFLFYTARVDVDVELEVRAVDRAGNVGPPTTLVLARLPDEGGCSAGGGAGGGVGFLGILGGLGLSRRRQPV